MPEYPAEAGNPDVQPEQLALPSPVHSLLRSFVLELRDEPARLVLRSKLLRPRMESRAVRELYQILKAQKL